MHHHGHPHVSGDGFYAVALHAQDPVLAGDCFKMVNALTFYFRKSSVANTNNVKKPCLIASNEESDLNIEEVEV
jgi:hypothetical protein